MRGKFIELTPERIADAKRLYEQTTAPTDDIAATLGVSRSTLDRRITDWGWLRRTAPRRPVDRALSCCAPLGAQGPLTTLTPAETRAANAARIQEIVAQTLDGIQHVLRKAGPANEDGAERSARTFAAVARTLQAIAPLTHADEMKPPDEADDDPVPRDMDEFRYELARRIRGFIENRRLGAGGISSQSEPQVE